MVQKNYGSQNNSGQNRFLVQITLGSKKKIWFKNNFGPQKNVVQKNFALKRFWSKKCWVKEIVGQKNVWSKKYLGPKKFGLKKKLGSNRIFGQKEYLVINFGSEKLSFQKKFG